jgi:putative ABC transport system permease protein
MFLRSLDRKLVRDLGGMKGQAIAIGLVLAAGIAMYVAYLSNFESLRRTQATYYDGFRFGDVFASCTRAPLRVEASLRTLTGVAAAETRVVVHVALDLPDVSEPIKGRLISIPADRRPALNDLFLRKGRWIETGRDDEVLVNEAFALAHRLEPGSTLAAIVNGRRHVLRVVGHALSPEYIYVLTPGEIIPDDTRYGIIWMERRALASAFDMEGGFNDVSLKLMPGTSDDEVVQQVDRLLRPWGGAGAVPRRLQLSHWALDNELMQLQSFGYATPAIFLAVAAFLLNMAMARTLTIQRPQIAALKALGYSNAAIGWHYVMWGLVIAAFGAAVGIAAGAWLGSAMIGIYNQYFRFPILLYELSGGVAVTALAIGLAASALGAVFAVRRAVAIPPAEAMRPEPPARYRTSVLERAAAGRLTHATRMVLRNLERRPGRALTSIVGIAFAVGILFFGFIFIDVMHLLVGIQFGQVQRQDVTVTFVEPRSAEALYAVQAMPGVLAAEAVRIVPARLRSGHRSRQLAITGQPADPDLSRIVDISGAVVTLPPEGLVLSKVLGDILAVRPGDRVTVEVLEGARPVFDVPVAALVDDYMGLGAFMEKRALHRLLHESDVVTGAHLAVDPARADVLYARLKRTPAVAGVSITAASRKMFEDTLAESFTIMTVFNVLFAGIIAFGVVYNAARISLSERSRELASLRVLGFSIGEISLILLGELALITLLAILPGLAVGWGLARLLLFAFQNELYRLPLIVTPQNAAWSSLSVIAAAAVSGFTVRRTLDRLDLVAVLKIRE